VNALQPTHNKQSFIMDNNYRLLVNNLKDQLAKYWYPPALFILFLIVFYLIHLPSRILTASLITHSTPFWLATGPP
jgi:hypothetical protein